MRTYKSCAASYDNPGYLIRNNLTLLHKDGKDFFMSKERHKYKMPEYKPIRVIHKEAKFGLSKDSPYISKLSYVNASTRSLNESNTAMSPRSSSRIIFAPNQPHELVREALRKSKGNSEMFTKVLRSQTPSKTPHAVTKVFTRMLDQSATKEAKVLRSFLNPWNLSMLKASAIANSKENRTTQYMKKMAEFIKMSRRSVSVRHSMEYNHHQGKGAKCMITEPRSTNISKYQ